GPRQRSHCDGHDGVVASILQKLTVQAPNSPTHQRASGSAKCLYDNRNGLAIHCGQPGRSYDAKRDQADEPPGAPWQRLYFLPEPQKHGPLRDGPEPMTWPGAGSLFAAWAPGEEPPGALPIPDALPSAGRRTADAG